MPSHSSGELVSSSQGLALASISPAALHSGLFLFEQSGEEYSATLGNIIAALGAIANIVGMTQTKPPVNDLRELYTTVFSFQLLLTNSLVPRMTPILRNRHEKVQEASINLIGRIADRGAEFVPP